MTSLARPSLPYRTSLKFLSCALLVPVADFLFYDHHIGWTLGLFGALLLVAIRLHQRQVPGDHSLLAFCVVLGLALALVETPGTLAICMFAFSIVGLALAPRLAPARDARLVARNILRYTLFTGWTRLLADNLIWMHIGKRRGKRAGQQKAAILRHWLLPISMSLVFILIFSVANPILAEWILTIRWYLILKYFSPARMLFWAACLAGCWALIRPKIEASARTRIDQPALKQPFTLTALLFNERSIFISLILFNGLFLLQNLCDLTFLWSGADLPEGTTHAAYARQGAYPLILTALLAALFVLIALKPGSSTEQRSSIRAMVYAWVGQNIFLVSSSMLRLANYIEDYSLTYMRVAAFIWMGLVAIGLGMIIARIYFGKTNLWLINANALALYGTLYLSCFVNFGSIVAFYNVTHAREVTGYGAALDVFYLGRIGTAALPALEWFVEQQPEAPRCIITGGIASACYYSADTLVKSLRQDVRWHLGDWRQWTYRDYRLRNIP